MIAPAKKARFGSDGIPMVFRYNSDSQIEVQND